jgi:predicted amidohydrolase YtcJ
LYAATTLEAGGGARYHAGDFMRAGPPLALAAALTAVSCSTPPRLAADLIVTDGRIWTGNPLQPEATAIAMIGERIVDVGSNGEIGQWRGPDTTVVEASGRRIVPGFNDAHVHVVDGGRQLDNVALRDADAPAEVVRRVGERARAKPGEWVLGGDWDEQRWTTSDLPTRLMIDDVASSTPVFVTRYDGRVGIANSTVLGRAGISETTPDPPGGVIVRDAHGYPTGVLRGAAMDLVTRVVPKMTPQDRRHAVQRALEQAASLGVTSLQDMNPTYEDLSVYAELANRGELSARISAALFEGGWYDQAKLGLHRSFGSPWLRIGAVKGYADGTIESATAYFFEPYADRTDTRGRLADEMQPLDGARTRLMAADHAGLQLCIHAIGDAGISQMLDLYGDIVAANGERDRRLRIEHAQHVAPKDIERFAALHVIASVQPYHTIDGGPLAERRIGHERAKTTDAFRTLVDNGVRLALGTDWPAAPLNPLRSVYAATTRVTLDGLHPDGWLPEQKLTVSEAVAAYTSGSAFAEFQEADKGTLARGKLADLVILSEDIFAIPPARIRDVQVLVTIAGGRVVHQRKP